ncbi:Alg9-like mannosyltransferase family-domain containing protein [Nitzschia inconspicua]|uniref:Mannosyltransferase n=1 Tax=Nitzschia inconspicua TaxID=303405 RepID=A0A9K3PZG7_9STRA|nr:Alg9-like mannosyltransferase family-domain containing protein [Nitzschia inconspicua]
MMPKSSSPLLSWTVYTILLIVRVIIAPFLPGYIHPDEFFQGGQELWFGCDSTPPWEFQPQHALRSVLPPIAMTWMPLRLYSWIFRRSLMSLSGQEVLVIPRMACAVASILLVDVTIWKVTRQCETMHSERNRGVPLSVLLLASAWPSILMLSRPFSNTMETFCVVALFGIVIHECLQLDTPKQPSSPLFDTVFAIRVGIICALGIFTRFTFAFFVAPILLFLLYTMVHQRSHRSRPLLYSLLWMFLSFAATSSLIIIMDTKYYQGMLDQQKESWTLDLASFKVPFSSLEVVLTPLNALHYNSQISNLKDHGLHPRWTHALVNMFVLYGPLTLVAYFSFFEIPLNTSTFPKQPPKESTLKLVSQTTIVFGLAALSAAPHQEPRFLLPMVTCLAIVGNSLLKGARVWRYFLLLWIIFNVALLTLYGLLHQAGVVYSTLAIGSSMASRTPSLWIYWRTYMPPTFLTRRSHQSFDETVCNKGNRILDLKGSSMQTLLQILESELQCDASAMSDLNTPIASSLQMVIPHLIEKDLVPAGWQQLDLLGSAYDCSFVTDFGPHLTTEDFPSIDMTSSNRSLSGYFRLGVYEVSCKRKK